MEFVIITGLSGAGKSRALEAIEDIGYFCIDNMPPALLEKFAELCLQSQGKLSKVALVIDIRGGDLFSNLENEIQSLKKHDFIHLKTIFLDANDSAIIRRYKETRRRHPLQDKIDVSIESALKKEREILTSVKNIADFIIDTSMLSAAQLKEYISKAVSDDKKGFSMNFVSFGFKYGILEEADMVFDVRFLPNPFYIDSLKHMTGKNDEVFDYVFGFKQTKIFTDKLIDLINFLIPNFMEEGKSSVIIGIGCTGGKHRSVAIARYLNDYFNNSGKLSAASHRDITK